MIYSTCKVCITRCTYVVLSAASSGVFKGGGSGVISPGRFSKLNCTQIICKKFILQYWKKILNEIGNSYDKLVINEMFVSVESSASKKP